MLERVEQQHKLLEHKQQMGTTVPLIPPHQLAAAVLVLHTKTGNSAVVEVAVALKPGWEAQGLLGKAMLAEVRLHLTLAAVVVVQVLWEAMLLPALLAVPVVPGQPGQKMVWTTPAAVAVVLNKLRERLLVALAAAATEETTQDHQPTQLPEP